MRIFLAAIPIIFLSSLAICQEKPKTADCSTLPSPSAGCKSFNEMVVKRDKDMLDYLSPRNHTYVCFRPGEDVFIIISYVEPDASFYVKDAKTGEFRSPGGMWYTRYSDGVIDDFHLVVGNWVRGSLNTFTTQMTNGTSGLVNDSETDFDYRYKNRAGNDTVYSFQIRISTLRFHESSTWEIPAVPKTVKTPAQPASQGSTANSGYCTEFKPQMGRYSKSDVTPDPK